MVTGKRSFDEQTFIPPAKRSKHEALYVVGACAPGQVGTKVTIPLKTTNSHLIYQVDKFLDNQSPSVYTLQTNQSTIQILITDPKKSSLYELHCLYFCFIGQMDNVDEQIELLGRLLSLYPMTEINIVPTITTLIDESKNKQLQKILLYLYFIDTKSREKVTGLPLGTEQVKIEQNIYNTLRTLTEGEFKKIALNFQNTNLDQIVWNCIKELGDDEKLVPRIFKLINIDSDLKYLINYAKLKPTHFKALCKQLKQIIKMNPLIVERNQEALLNWSIDNCGGGELGKVIKFYKILQSYPDKRLIDHVNNRPKGWDIKKLEIYILESLKFINLVSNLDLNYEPYITLFADTKLFPNEKIWLFMDEIAKNKKNKILKKLFSSEKFLSVRKNYVKYLDTIKLYLDKIYDYNKSFHVFNELSKLNLWKIFLKNYQEQLNIPPNQQQTQPNSIMENLLNYIWDKFPIGYPKLDAVKQFTWNGDCKFKYANDEFIEKYLKNKIVKELLPDCSDLFFIKKIKLNLIIKLKNKPQENKIANQYSRFSIAILKDYFKEIQSKNKEKLFEYCAFIAKYADAADIFRAEITDTIDFVKLNIKKFRVNFEKIPFIREIRQLNIGNVSFLDNLIEKVNKAFFEANSTIKNVPENYIQEFPISLLNVLTNPELGTLNQFDNQISLLKTNWEGFKVGILNLFCNNFNKNNKRTLKLEIENIVKLFKIDQVFVQWLFSIFVNYYQFFIEFHEIMTFVKKFSNEDEVKFFENEKNWFFQANIEEEYLIEFNSHEFISFIKLTNKINKNKNSLSKKLISQFNEKIKYEKSINFLYK